MTRDEVDKLLRSPSLLTSRDVQERRFPRLPSTVHPNDLPANVRVQACLKNLASSHGITDLGELHRLTIGELLCLKNFGWKSLVDLLTFVAPMILDYASQSSGASTRGRQTMSSAVTQQARRLFAQSYSAHIGCTDPRFAPEVGTLLYAANSDSDAPPLDASASLQAVAARLMGRTRDAVAAERILGAIRKLRHKIVRAHKMPLEKELRDITRAFAEGRDIDIILSSLGGEGRGAKALQTVGDEFGITRERVRQIMNKFVRDVQRVRPFAPALNRVISQIYKRLPAATDELETEVSRLGLTQSLFRLDGIPSAAEALSVPVPFVIENHLGLWMVVDRKNASLAKAIVGLARKRVSHAGLSKVADLRDQVRKESGVSVGIPLIKRVLQSVPSLRWLDEEREWFLLEDVQRNHLVTRVTKLLSVARRIHVNEMLATIASDHRVKGLVLPKHIALEFCRIACNAKLDGDFLIASETLSAAEVLSEGEQLAYSILLDSGPLLDRGAFERKCLERGMNRNTFAAYVRRLPIVARYGPGVYGLRGALV